MIANVRRTLSKHVVGYIAFCTILATTPIMEGNISNTYKKNIRGDISGDSKKVFQGRVIIDHFGTFHSIKTIKGA